MNTHVAIDLAKLETSASKTPVRDYIHELAAQNRLRCVPTKFDELADVHHEFPVNFVDLGVGLWRRHEDVRHRADHPSTSSAAVTSTSANRRAASPVRLMPVSV